MKVIITSLVCLTAAFAFAETNVLNDAKIKRLIVRSGQVIDNSSLAREAFQYARNCCGDDTNRFARLVFELAQTNDVRIANRMMTILGVYGTTNQLPFLHSMATNVYHGAAAVGSVLRLEGVTSNSIACAERFFSSAGIDQFDRSYVCSEFFHKASESSVPLTLRTMAQQVALRYAATANLYFRRMDESMIETDHSYEISRRRLSVLRSVHALGVSQYQIAYVTNAINTLVAYPEANLPE